jgi:D-alanyl-D-alanine carboxypeptidase (penicillin-binding protein 5/6)
MKASHFTNASGMPGAEHYSSAMDIAQLARAVVRDFPEYYEWYSVREFSFNGIRQYNRNSLLGRDPSVDGMKTGHTESAGFCLVSSAKRDSMRLIAVVMGSKSDKARTDESQALMNYGFRFFETHELYAAQQPLNQKELWKGAVEQISLGLEQDVRVVIPRGHYDRLKATMELPQVLVAPVQKGQALGLVRIRLDDKLLIERPLVALDDGPEGGIFRRLGDGIALWWRGG